MSKKWLALLLGMLCLLMCSSALAVPECGTEGSEYEACSISPDYLGDENLHWHECMQCGKRTDMDLHWSACSDIGLCSECHAPYTGDNVRPHAASCDAPGVCCNCGEVVSNLPIASHHDLYMRRDDTHHMTYCGDCGQFLGKEEHYVRCGSGSSGCYECSFSGTIAKVEHNWGFNSVCRYQDEKTHVYICTRCGDTRSEKQ